jgi:ferredoxin
MSRMTSPKAERYKLSSFNLEKPGLLALLFRRSLTVGKTDYVFHLGLYGSIITGALMEIAYLVPQFTRTFNGLGWRLSWLHAVTGILLLAGGFGLVSKYFKRPQFRLAWRGIFYLDLLFMAAVVITGSFQAVAVFGLMPAVFVVYPLQWAGDLHVIFIGVWIVASLLYGGAVRHGLAAVAWRLTNTENKHSLAMAFSDACGRCGRCVEVCPLYEAMEGAAVEAPVLKLKRYFRMVATGSLLASEVKSIAEQTAVCTMCGLCAGVCPFSFNFVEMYKELLAYANKLYPTVSPGQLVVPETL